MPTIVTDVIFPEEGQGFVRAGLTDSEGTVVTPQTVRWSLVDDSGGVINDRNSEAATPAAETEIEVFGADLAIQPGEESKSSVRRHMAIRLTYIDQNGNPRTMNHTVTFAVANDKGVPIS